MRLLILTIFSLALFGQQQPQPSQQQPAAGSTVDPNQKRGRITGKVLNALTGEPLRKANVTLMAAGAGGAGRQAVSASTDNAGAFVFEGVDAGDYRLSGEKTGFIRTNMGGRGAGSIGSQLKVGQGSEIADAIIRLTPQGIVSGRILDEDGEPLEGVMVQLMRPQFFNNQRRMGGMSGNQTNDRGEFRITNVAPGKYYASIQYMRMMNGGAPIQQGKEELGYPKLYFPGVETMEQAQRIEVGAGQEFSGVQMALKRVRVYRIRGKVAGVEAPQGQKAEAGSRMRYMIQLRNEASTGDTFGGFMGGPGGSGGVRPDGTFELANVIPGAYRLTVMEMGQGRPKVMGAAKVSVGNDHLEGVVVSPLPEISMTGKVSVEGDAATINLKSIRIQLVPSESGFPGFQQPSEVKEDGTFALTDLAPEKYRVAVMLGGAFFVKAINVGGQDLKDTGLDLSSGGGGAMVVVLSTKVAKLDGTVEKQKAEDAPGTVVLAKTSAAGELSLLTQGFGSPMTATVDQSGKFSFASLPPGEYKAFAFEDVDMSIVSDPEYLKKFQDRASNVKIGEGESKSLTLKQVRYAESNPNAQ